MKPKLHPKWYPEAQVICACGNTWKVGATVPTIKTDVCSRCHPFYTGEQRIVDTAGQVDRFMSRLRAREERLREREARIESRTNPELMGLDVLGLGTNIEKVLKGAGLATLADLLKTLEEKGDEGLTSIKGIGLEALAAIKRTLRAQGFSLPGDAA